MLALLFSLLQTPSAAYMEESRALAHDAALFVVCTGAGWREGDLSGFTARRLALATANGLTPQQAQTISHEQVQQEIAAWRPLLESRPIELRQPKDRLTREVRDRLSNLQVVEERLTVECPALSARQPGMIEGSDDENLDRMRAAFAAVRAQNEKLID